MSRPRTFWQPIETAPKDGTRVLAFEDTGQSIVYWYEPQEVWFGEDGFVAHPTDWQPLPDPPEGR